MSRLLAHKGSHLAENAPQITRNGRSGQEEREAGSCYHRISPGERTYWRLAGLWSCLGNLSKRKNLIWHEPLRGLHPVTVKLDPIAPAGLIKGSRPQTRQQVTIVDARVSNQYGAVDLSAFAVLASIEHTVSDHQDHAVPGIVRVIM